MLLVFVLYVIGFVIWKSYLGGYGVSSIGFLQVEYLAAALCYVFVVATVAVPPLLLLQLWFAKLTPAGWQYHTFSTAVYLWSFLSLYFISLLFPFTGKVSSADYAFLVVSAVALLQLLLYVIGRRRYGESGVFRAVMSHKAIDVYVIVSILLRLFLHPSIKTFFVVSAILMCSFAVSGLVGNVWGRWSAYPPTFKVLLFATISGLVLSNVGTFGSLQFGRMRRQYGGGMPETAYLKFAPQQQALAVSMNIPAATNLALSDGFFGPVSILLRTEKEIVFIDYQDLLLTNVVAIHQTNVVTTAGMPVATNVVSTLTINVVKRPSSPHAKQLRADLVEAVIFAK